MSLTPADLDRWRVTGWLRAYPLDDDRTCGAGLGISAQRVRRVRATLHRFATGYRDIGEAQRRALSLLSASPVSLRTGTVAKRIGMGHANACKSLRRLAARGLVRRVDAGGARWVCA